MPETTEDEVVSNRAGTGGGTFARPVTDETVEVGTGITKTVRTSTEEDTLGEGGPKGRALKESTQKMLDRFEQEERESLAPHEEGDADEDEPADDDTGDGRETVEVAAAARGDDAGESAEGDPEAEGAGEEEAPDPVAEWQTKAQTLEQRNREIVAELEAARKTPKAQRTERETALLAAESSYVEEGSVAALRKFLGVIIGAAPDSKEVSGELAGVFADLSAMELGVPLDPHQQALRDNARTRLLLARDKREKAEAEKKPAGNGADEVQYEAAAQYVENVLATKGQSGASLADEYPMLMDLAQDFDGYKPAEVLARAIRQEMLVGALDPNVNPQDAIRAVAPKIESYYDALGKKIDAARAKKNKKTDTTKPSVKPKVAAEPSKEQRQSHGARTITNATASRAPAKPPKTTKQKASTNEKKTRKDFPSDSAWREYLLTSHFPS